MSIDTTTSVAPATGPERTTAGARVAADLRTLAEIIDAHPIVGPVLATVLGLIKVHIPVHSALTPTDLIGHLIAAGGHETMATAWSEPWFPAAAGLLPAGGIRLVATQMCDPGPSEAAVAGLRSGDDPELDAAFDDAAELFRPARKAVQA